MVNSSSIVQKTYRPEIDGLRTIAILSVVFYHAKFFFDGQNVISGGFIGVDIFFVISGYLISSILITSIKSDNFSLLNFYERRARRILPILLFVMAVSIPFAWYLLLPNDFIDFSYQLLTGIFSSSNFYFWLEDDLYWATESSLKPFLHTWSLGVEEQFYLVMPLFLLGILRFNQSKLYYWLFGFLILSLAYAQWASLNYPQQSYYLLPSRAWELLAGACLASVKSFTTNKNIRFTTYFPSIGITLILASIFLFDKQTLHPSFYTLVPIIGTMLIIHFANDVDFSVKLLRSKLFVSIGLISYGLYVWHFPVFAFFAISDGYDDINLKIGLIFGLIALSTASYYVIEKPFRNFDLVPSKIFVLLIFVCISTISIFSYWGTFDGFKYRLPDLVNQPEKLEKIENHQWHHTSKELKGRIILVGDSHTNSIAPSLKSWALSNGYNFANSGFIGCQLIVGTVRVQKKTFKPSLGCNIKRQEKRITFITNSEPSVVVLGGRLPLILEEERFDNQEGGYEGKMQDFIQNAENPLVSLHDRQEFIKKQYTKTVQMILDMGHQVVLIYPIPEVGWHVSKTLLKRIGKKYLDAREIAKKEPVTTSYKVFKDRTLTSYQLLDSIDGNKVYRIYPESLFCNTAIFGRCVTHNQEVIFYRDDDHLSEVGAELMVGEIEKILGKLDYVD